MIETLKSKGLVLCLWASPETILKRTTGNSSRPLLQNDAPRNKIEKLLREREERYRLADGIISTDDKSEQEVANDISNHYLESLH
jgi:shikimate kinase